MDSMIIDVKYQKLAQNELAVVCLVELSTFVSGRLSRFVRCVPVVDRTFEEFVAEIGVLH